MYLSHLFNKIKGKNTVGLILMKEEGRLRYFMTTSNIGFVAITTGVCDGDIEGSLMSYNLSLETVTPLMDHGMDLKVRVVDGNLRFETENGDISITPLYVESIDVNAQRLLEKYQSFMRAKEGLADVGRLRSALKEGQDALDFFKEALEDVRARYKEKTLNKMDLEESGEFNLDDGVFAEDEDDVPFEIEEDRSAEESDLVGKIEKLEKNLGLLKQGLKKAEDKMNGVTVEVIDLSKFHSIVDVAAKQHLFISMCADYAVVSMQDCHLMQKGSCPVKGVAGLILNQLIRDKEGTGFYSYNDALVYYSEGDDSVTTVFLEPYMPNTAVDKTLITKGHVLERYKVDMSSLSIVISFVRGKYTRAYMDMGDGTCHFLSEQSEEMVIKLAVSETKTLELSRAMKDVSRMAYVKMAKFYLPLGVIRLLYMFRKDVTIYVKEHKIIFERDGLYLVFGRSNVK